ncbi:hypothetical protein AB833_28630 [Chromatiales bacterium (ex Bugula neritina AB1)]|nr:hypothetical protein AB833_28630 [Chromatiales bacterium (ex Bugula neritina AB1)]
MLTHAKFASTTSVRAPILNDINHQTVKALNPDQQLSADDDWTDVLTRVAEHRDKQAFTRLFTHFGPKVKAYGMALNSAYTSSEMADELVQEVMIKVWEKARSFNAGKASAGTWIFAIARNCRIDYLRKMKRIDSPLNADDLWPLQEQPDPATTLNQTRNEQAIQFAVNDLPQEQAMVLREIYVEGKTYAEVATQNALPVSTVKSRVRLAIEKLRTGLQYRG